MKTQSEGKLNKGQILMSLIKRINGALVALDLNFIDEVIMSCQKDLEDTGTVEDSNIQDPILKKYQQEKIDQLIRIRNAARKLRELAIAEDLIQKGKTIPDFTFVDIEPVKYEARSGDRKEGYYSPILTPDNSHRPRIIDMNDPK